MASSYSAFAPFNGEKVGKTFMEKKAEKTHSKTRNSPLIATTVEIRKLFQSNNPKFVIPERTVKRILSDPSEGVSNNGRDNSDANLICSVNDVLESPQNRYIVLDILGQGTFGQVFRCQEVSTKSIVAIKIIKNKPAYRAQAKIEIKVARFLNETCDPEDKHHIVRLLSNFVAYNHLCLVFELLGNNLYDMLKNNQFRGLPLTMVQSLTKQMLESLSVLEMAKVIHCDLKPENVLLVRKKTNVYNTSNCQIKLIDFGSACWEGHTMYSYIQSRFYRSPEVLLGLPYDGAIDMWSLGCVCIEMFLGLPIFPGVSDHNQISRIIEILGYPPEHMLQNGRDTLKFFKKERSFSKGYSLWSEPSSENQVSFVLKTSEEYAREKRAKVPNIKNYHEQSTLSGIIYGFPMPKRRFNASKEEENEKERRRVFIHFCTGLLSVDPWKRWTTGQALNHPFVTGIHTKSIENLDACVPPAESSLLNERMNKHIERLRYKQQLDRTTNNGSNVNGKNMNATQYRYQQHAYGSSNLGNILLCPVDVTSEMSAKPSVNVAPNSNQNVASGPIFYSQSMMSNSGPNLDHILGSSDGQRTGQSLLGQSLGPDLSRNMGKNPMPDYEGMGSFQQRYGLGNSEQLNYERNNLQSYSYGYLYNGQSAGGISGMQDLGQALKRPNLRPSRSNYQYYQGGNNESYQGSVGSFMGPPSSYMSGMSSSPTRLFHAFHQNKGSDSLSFGGLSSSSQWGPNKSFGHRRNPSSPILQKGNEGALCGGDSKGVSHAGVVSPPRSRVGSNEGELGRSSFIADAEEWDPFFKDELTEVCDSAHSTGQQSWNDKGEAFEFP